ncbi:hypothetical protein M0M57_03875 [Flavobacterium azooxidireducens]|uniref:Carboxypeptidase-like regulatory domain-containing protein n=1 Tax=Flavobacterium azooxidireducens TaxID=1871076 RepID=A0ABY4KHF7_9FLAO|nr:hypothetical protein [Flavobacterium azooxidireducens]UPQ79979.1 hypothetical protein M0M57_03875 [Flavobacterium azooxidireducens]
MNRTLFFLLFSFFTTTFVLGQKQIHGVVKVENASAEGIHITNLVSEKSTVTNEKGEFWLDVKEDDLLVFSAVHLNYWRKSISENDIKNGFIEVIMTTKEQKLEEVVVTEYTKINAQDLGIIDYKPKKYTPAERRLRTAEKLKWYSPLLIPLGGMSVDGLINQISGRTNQLKKEVQIEKKELLLKKLNDWYENEFYVNQLTIPVEYINGFKVFVVYDEEFIDYLNSNDTINGSLRISKLAVEFLTYLNTDE